MRRTLAAIGLALSLGAAGAAQASPATDDFGRCLVNPPAATTGPA
jgi:hypothetical protein